MPRKHSDSFAAAWILGGVVLLVVSVHSAARGEENATDSVSQDTPRSERIEAFLDAAEWAMDYQDWKTVLSNARSALKLDPDNAAAKELEWEGLAGPIPEQSEGGFKYKVCRRDVIVTGIEDQSATELNIPARIAGQPVVRIGSLAFEDCKRLSAVTIPDSVTTLGKGSFCGCESLPKITIPASVTHIGPAPFVGCKRLPGIALARGSTSFRSIDGVLFSEDGKTIIAFPMGKEQTEYTIPDSVTRVSDWAFFWCENLTTITIPDSVTHIGKGAFSDCCSLTSVTIPGWVRTISKEAFSSCTNLTKVTIPNSVTEIEECAFLWCRNLNAIAVPGSVTTIGDHAFFGCERLSSLTIPKSVRVGRYAFGDCKRLAAVTIKDSVEIGYSAFSACEKLTTVTIGNSVKIGADAFEDCPWQPAGK